MINPELSKKIIDENIKVHTFEAKVYRQIHPEVYNWYQQLLIRKDLKKIFDLNHYQTVLDVGCGTGNITLKLLRHRPAIDAVDLSQEMLEVLRIELQKVRREKDVRFFKMEIEAFIQDCKKKYDLITMSSVLHHFPDYLRVLQKLCSLLNPRGILYVTHEPCGQYHLLREKGLLKKLLKKIDEELYDLFYHKRIRKISAYYKNLPVRDCSYSDYHYFQGFQEEQVKQELLRSGLKIIQYHPFCSELNFGLSNLFDTIFLKTQSHFQIIAQK